jgi:hypothetical protein
MPTGIGAIRWLRRLEKLREKMQAEALRQALAGRKG